MKKIKIVQIGTGHDHASVTFSALRRLSDIFEVLGYVRLPEDKGFFDAPYYEGAKEMTLEDVMERTDIDAVVIETFDLALVKYAQIMANKGVHIQMDKAPGENVEEFERLLSTIKNKKLVFNMGYIYRFNPMIKQAFERVKNGELGRIYSVEAEMSCFWGKDKRKWLDNFKGGMMHYLGCHLVDLIVRLQGVPDEIIPLNFSTGFDGVNSKDVAFALFKYSGGISTIKSSIVDCGGYVRRHFTIHGEKGTIDIRPLEKFESYPSGISTKMTSYSIQDGWHGLGVSEESGEFDRYQKMLISFAKMIRGERDLEVDLETEARIQRCLLKADGIDIDYKKEIIL